VDAAFNTYIDYAASNPGNFNVGDGHPLALATEAGALTEAAADFSISMGVLDETGNQAPAGESADPLIILQLVGDPGTANVTICADTLRGPDSGVVGSVLESNLQAGCIAVDVVVVGGEEPCWLYDCHGFGDADGDCDVDAADVGVAVGGWNNYDGMTGDIKNLCADTDKDGDVDAADIGMLVQGWNNGCGECTPK
jgi:hypothetical protein